MIASDRQPGDIEIEKLKYSSFHGTDFHTQLRARGGQPLRDRNKTDCCVGSTTRDAFLHHHVVVVSDACGLSKGAATALISLAALVSAVSAAAAGVIGERVEPRRLTMLSLDALR